MDERIQQFRVGVMVFFVTILTVLLIALFTSKSTSVFKRHYDVTILFRDATGVNESTPIKKSGILIGRVTKVELTPEGDARVAARIDEDKMIRQDEVPTVHRSLLGDAVIDIIRTGGKEEPRAKEAARQPHLESSPPAQQGEEQSPAPVAPGAELRGQTFSDPIEVVSRLQERLSEAIGSVAHTSEELRQVARQVNILIGSNQESINRIVKQTDDATEQLRRFGHSANELFASPEAKAKFQQTIDQMPQLLKETRETEVMVKEMVADLQKNSKNVNKFTEALGENGAAVISQLGQSAQKLDSVLGQMVRLTTTLNSTDGSLGKLINDPTLYQRINTAAENIEDLSRQLKPVLRNVNLLTDQLARHPEKLGLRGALERSPGTKWPTEPTSEWGGRSMDADP